MLMKSRANLVLERTSRFFALHRSASVVSPATRARASVAFPAIRARGAVAIPVAMPPRKNLHAGSYKQPAAFSSARLKGEQF